MVDNNSSLIKEDVERIVIFDTKENKELAVITDDTVDTANSDILVKIKFKD